jgi:hypothetical protein
MKRADDRDFFRCLKAMCVSRVSRSGSRGRGGGIPSEREVVELHNKSEDISAFE